MKTRIKNIAATVAICLIMAYSQGQNIHIKHSVKQDGIYFRWYPKDITVFREMMDKGVVATRTILPYEDYREKQPSEKIINPAGFRRGTFTSTAEYTLNRPETAVIDSCLSLHSATTANLLEFREKLQAQENLFFYSILLLQKDFQFACDMGMGFVDSGVSQSENVYLYKFYIPGSICKDTMHAIVQSDPDDSKQLIPVPGLSQSGKYVRIAYAPGDYFEKYYGLYIERSLDSGRTLHRIHGLPILPGMQAEKDLAFFLDSMPGNKKLLYYRLQAIDYFSDFGPYSDTVSILLYPINEEHPASLKVEEVEMDRILHWQFNEAAENKILGFRIYRSDSVDGEKKPLNDSLFSPASRNAVIGLQETGNYIFVHAINFDSSDLESFPVFVQLPDTTAPEVPAITAASVDSTGLVFISWGPARDLDILGYQIYRSNSRTAEFSNISSSWNRDTFLRDTLNISWIRDSIYYKIVAADKRYNESRPSAIIALVLPSKIPPDAPLLVEAKSTDIGVLLKWIPSEAAGIAYYEVFRKAQNENRILLAKIHSNANTDSFMDKSTALNTEYTYTVKAANFGGISSSFSPEMSIKTNEISPLPPVYFTRIWSDTTQKKMFFQWLTPDFEVSYYRIIGISGERTATVATTAGYLTSCAWNYSGTKWFEKYIIIAYSKDGRRSIP